MTAGFLLLLQLGTGALFLEVVDPMSEQQAAIAALPDPTSKVPRAVLEDRYDGLMVRRRGPNVGDYNEFQTKIDLILARLVEGTARTEGDEDNPLVGELETLIREHVIRRVDELGMAR
jgi:hypothetical protein